MRRVLDISAALGADNLLDRSAGERVDAALRDALRRLPEQGLLIVRGGGIRHAAYSGLSAALSAFTAPDKSIQDRYLLLQISGDQDELTEAIEHLAQERKTAFPAMDEAENWRVFGRLTAADRQALDFVLALQGAECVTSALLARRLEIGLTAASNRLRNLFARRLIRREERLRPVGGREFVYRPLLAGYDVTEE